MGFRDNVRTAIEWARNEGPVRPNGTWRPAGGYETFVHSHQFEPLPIFDREQAKVDAREDKELFKLMRRLSELETDEDVATCAAQHFGDSAERPAPGDCIVVVSETLIRRMEPDGSFVEIRIPSASA